MLSQLTTVHRADGFVFVCSRYCCNVGSFHAKQARDPSAGATEDEQVKEWLLFGDRVLVRAAATAMRLDELKEGIHLHDIVLQYLRKRLSAEEMRAEHRNVFAGMMAASRSRMVETGQQMEDTGSTERATDGEELDW